MGKECISAKEMKGSEKRRKEAERGSEEGTNLILASASPRRAELLRQLGLRFQVQPADIDETIGENESPEDYVRRLAVEKAEAISLVLSRSWRRYGCRAPKSDIR